MPNNNSIMSSLRKAIYDYSLSSSVLNDIIQGKIYFNEAPKDADCPYCVFSILPINTKRDTGYKFYEAIVQFNVYEASQILAEILSERLIDIFEDSYIPINGFDFVKITKQPVYNLGKIDKTYGIVIPYSIEFQN